MWIMAAPTMRFALHEWIERMSQPNETWVMMKRTLSYASSALAR
jgi:hypothetical protein